MVYITDIFIVFMFLAFIVPTFMFVLFEIGILLHQKRSGKFCGIKFDVCNE